MEARDLVQIHTCARCGLNVLPAKDGICPGCGHVFEPEVPWLLRQNDVVQDVAGQYPGCIDQAALLVKAGNSREEVCAHLESRGLDGERALAVVNILFNLRKKALQEVRRKNMFHGAFWCIGGIIVTTVTYQSALNTGGFFVVAWGAILFGAIRFFRGLMQSTEEECDGGKCVRQRENTVLNQQDVEGLRASFALKSTQELKAIYNTRDTDEYRPEAIEAARALLVERGETI